MATDGDGNVWVIDSDGVVRVTTAAAPPSTTSSAGSSGREIALGGDGRMWWADFGGNAIQATTTAGVTTKATDLTSGPQGIAAGPGTQMAFGQPNNLLGRISPGGAPLFTTDTGGDAGLRDRVRPGRRLLGAALPQGQHRPADRRTAATPRRSRCRPARARAGSPRVPATPCG